MIYFIQTFVSNSDKNTVTIEYNTSINVINQKN